MIPEHLKGALDRYVNHRIRPGGFLEAVLSNDLFEAMARADVVSRECLFDICKYIYNELPGDCWGSRGRVERWLR